MNKLIIIVKLTFGAMLCTGVAAAQSLEKKQTSVETNDISSKPDAAGSRPDTGESGADAPEEVAAVPKKDEINQENGHDSKVVSPEGEVDKTTLHKSSQKSADLETVIEALNETTGTARLGNAQNYEENDEKGQATDSEKNRDAMAGKSAKPSETSGFGFFRSRDRDGRLLISAPIAGYWRTDDGYDLFTEKTLLWNPGLNVEVTLVSIRQRLHIAASFTWLRERAESKFVLGGEFNSKWSADMLVLGVRARYSLLSWFDAHGRVYGGLETTKVRMTSDEGAFLIPRDEKFATGGALGVDVHTPSFRFTDKPVKFPVFSPGISVEAGYEYRGPVDMDLVAMDDSEFAIETIALSAGKLTRAAPFVRIDLYLRF